MIDLMLPRCGFHGQAQSIPSMPYSPVKLDRIDAGAGGARPYGNRRGKPRQQPARADRAIDRHGNCGLQPYELKSLSNTVSLNGTQLASQRYNGLTFTGELR